LAVDYEMIMPVCGLGFVSTDVASSNNRWLHGRTFTGDDGEGWNDWWWRHLASADHPKLGFKEDDDWFPGVMLTGKGREG